jgi:putative transposase
MSYSLDLRKKVIDYVENGGSITKAAALFNIKHRQRKLDWKALSKDVQENPEARLRDRAEKFGVRPSAICYA